ncbi:response regulator [Romeria aff. gracilis LEGE 07310]|uniref:histidine kinase n=1 Tax=Vasconcelosia minhoensis LEGE 07310 TaxID=915328 RepID=A0A8J7AJU6_9CYAN|nr:ATP-binding protein [Romeria gracilis]MBE9080396.1 response regulator [Romeria aff. gracilis LEGE 07310]
MNVSAPRSLLLIDDNPDDRLLAKRELSRKFPELKISEVGHPDGFAQALEALPFDLVVTDYQLGWSTGLEVLRSIKDRRPDCPVIMFTNTGTEEIAVAGMKQGLDDYVIKSPQHFTRLPQATQSAWEKAQMRRQNARLESRLQALLSQLDLGIFRAQPDGRLLEVNPAFLRMLQLPSLAAAQALVDAQLKISSIERVADQGASREILLHRADGSSIWLRLSETLSQVDSELIVEGLVEDISLRKQAEAQIRDINRALEDRVQQRTAELERANNEMEGFAYSISHDLRSPIRQINSFMSLLAEQLQGTDLDQTVQHYLSVVSELTVQASDMLDALLNFSRTGRVEMKAEEVNMMQLVKTLRTQAEALSSDCQISWQIEPLPSVRCDRELLRTVWQNLLENAVKFTCTRSDAKITVGSSQGDSEVIFFVKDNGVGFDPKQADKLFGVFQRAHSSRDYSGTGIGLANVQRAILRHGGRVWAEGQVGQGATFYFSLPQPAPT